jgi:hypothetical protein
MKFLILIFILSISIQPLQAGFCDMEMEMNQEGAHQMDHSEPDDHDCCESDNSDQTEGCDGEMHCGSCLAGASPLPSMIKINPAWGEHHSSRLSSGIVLPSHASPPFRPPIS